MELSTQSPVTETETPAVCNACGGSFMALSTSLGGRAVAVQAFCDPCLEHKRTEEADAKAAVILPHERMWNLITPAEYRDYDAKLLPDCEETLNMRRRAYMWSGEGIPRWLVLVGPKGQGKTRIAFQALKHAGRNGGTMRYVRASQLDKWSSGQFQDGSNGAHEIQRCHTARWLFIDDLGKGKLSERAEAELYDLIEHRSANRMPLILTSNLDIVKLPWWSADRGEAIAGRILDNSTITRP